MTFRAWATLLGLNGRTINWVWVIVWYYWLLLLLLLILQLLLIVQSVAKICPSYTCQKCVPANCLIICSSLRLIKLHVCVMQRNELSILSTPAGRVVLPLLAHLWGLPFPLNNLDYLAHLRVADLRKRVLPCTSSCSVLQLVLLRLLSESSIVLITDAWEVVVV